MERLMACSITHNTNLLGRGVQSYSKDGLVVIDFNKADLSDHQEWTPSAARIIVRLLTLAIADAELES
jgi:hypothetical protein